MSDDNDKMVRETVRAKKWPAMEARGVEEQDIALLQTRYTSLEAIKAAGTEGLVELGFEEAKAAEILAKVRSSPGKGKTAAKKAEEVQIERMELVEDKHHVYTETEQELVAIAAEKDVEIPLKVIVDIASRIEGKEVSSEDKQKLIEVAGRRIRTVHISDYDLVNECHWLPYEGRIDWGAFLADLRKKAGYDGVLMHEVKRQRRNGTETTTRDLADSFERMFLEYNRLMENK